MFVLGFEDFWRKIAKEQNLENLGIIGLLCRSVGNPHYGVDLRQGVGYPRRSEAEVPKWHPLSMPRRSISTPWRSYYSQQAIFGLLFRKSSFRTPIV